MLSVIVPVFNEQATLPLVLARIGEALPQIEKEIVIVDDFSNDGTREWLRANFPEDSWSGRLIESDGAGGVTLSPAGERAGLLLKVIYHEVNSGKGAALRTGLAAATGEVFVFQDADLEYEPADWTEMYKLIAVRKVADVVYGSRFYGCPHRSLNFHHYLGNRVITTLFNAIYNQTLTDVEVCYKMFSREVKETLHLTCNDFGCEIQFGAQVSLANHWRIYEMGIRYFGRTYAEGKKIRWMDGVKAFWYLLKFRLDGNAWKWPTLSPRARPLLKPSIALCTTFALFAGLLAVYAASPVTTAYDSRWAIHTAMSFVRGHGGSLNEYLPALTKNQFYAIEYPDGKPRTRYPIGVSVLAAPFVAVASWINPTLNDRLQNDVLDRFEKFIASIFGALAGAVFFWLILTRFENVPIALGSTAIFCLATPMWSTATRALWQHGPLVLMLVIAMLLLERARRRPDLIQFIGLPLAMAYLVRPTAIVPIILMSGYVLLFYRPWFIRYMGWAMLIGVPWLVFNYRVYHVPVPWYYWHEAFSATTRFKLGIVSAFFSPSRGLFIFSPVLIFALSGFVLAWRERQDRALHLVYGGTMVGISIIVGAASMWWGGHSFGPRLMTDTLPFFVYFTAFNFDLPTTVRPRTRYAFVTVLVMSALAGVAINAQGALRQETLVWNGYPRNIDQDPMRAWDWRDPQFAR